MIILDIQEFYELTLLDDTKTIQQKTVETLQIANKWEDGTSGPISFITNAANKVSKIGGLKGWEVKQLCSLGNHIQLFILLTNCMQIFNKIILEIPDFFS